MRSIDYSYHYKKWHPSTAEHTDQMVSFYADLLKQNLGTEPINSLLDVGCGMGFAMIAAKELGIATVRGVDIDSGQVEAARNAGLDVLHEMETVAFLSRSESMFDVVLCMDVIEHIPVDQQVDFVAALRNSLKPNGRLLCTVPNANSSMASRWRYIDWTHHASFTEHSLDFLLHSGGFSSISVREMEFLKKPAQILLPLSGARHWWAFCFFRAVRRLQVMAELGPAVGRHVPLSLNILAVARK